MLKNFDFSASVIFAGKVFSGMKVSFYIKKTLDKEPNELTLKLYNLNRDTRTLIEEDKGLIIVNAGYVQGSGEEIVFIGSATKKVYNDENVDTYYTIEASDGIEEMKKKYISLSFIEGSKTTQILNQITKKLGLPLKYSLKQLSFKDKTYNNGLSYVGSLSKLLSVVTKDVNLEWSIQNNNLKIIEKDKKDLSTGILLNKDTGLIGKPTRLLSEKKTSVKKDGWKIESLLQSGFEPGGIIAIDSEIVEGEFKIDQVEHTGDTESGEIAKSVLEVVKL